MSNSLLTFDCHVHIAALRQDAGTDHYLHQPNFYMRSFLSRLNLPKSLLTSPDANELIWRMLQSYIAASTIDRFVLLAMDSAYDDMGAEDEKHTAFALANDFVADLAARHPRVLFGASIHPYRPDALTALSQVLAKGACLMKWIPSAQNIGLDDPRCIPFYEALAHFEFPLLVHTGREHVTTGRAQHLNNPELLIYPLRYGVRVIAAHCGTRMFLHEKSHFKTFCRMALEHEHLYGDLAAFGIPTRMGNLRTLLRQPALTAKLIYGSDFPGFIMPRSFIFSIGITAVRKILQEANPLQRPVLLMNAMGVPQEVFTRAGTLLHLPKSLAGAL